MDILTKNFSFVEKMNDTFLEKESHEIEKIMYSHNYEGLGLKGRKISEYVLKKYYELKGVGLYQLINEYKSYYSKYIIVDALHYIRRWGNQESHFSIDETEDIDFTTALNLVKSISTLLRDAWQRTNAIKQDVFVFSEKPYLKDDAKEISTNEKKAISNKINDQEVVVSKTSVIDLFADDNTIFYIPYYQRDYTWDSNNIDTLLNDVKSRKGDNHIHYFGVIAIKEEVVDGKTHVRIIDGQQRITTSILLLKAGLDFLNKYYKDEIQYMPEYLSMFKNNFENRYKNESQEPGKLNEWIQIMENKFVITENKGKYWKYGQNYIHIFQKLEEIRNETEGTNSHLEIIDLLNIFANKFELAIVKYDVKKKREMNIFENMNSKGTELTEWNLVKNQILNLIEIKDMSDQEKIDILKSEFFNEFVQNLKSKADQYLNEFITEFVWINTIMQSKEYNTYSRFPVYNNFKEIFKSTMETRDKYMQFLEKLRKYGTIFRALDKQDITIFNKILSNNQSRIDNITTKKQIFPLVFMIIKKTSEWKDGSWNILNINSLRQCIEILDTWLIRSEVVSGFGHSLRNVAVSIATDIFHDKTPDIVSSLISSMHKNKLFEDDIAFKSALINSKLKEQLLRKILYQLEIYLQDKKKSSNFNIKINEISLEHIMPKDSKYWENDLIGKMPREKFNEQYNEHVRKLGNMMTLPKSQNSSMKNDSWTSKKKSYAYQNRPISVGDKSLCLEPFVEIKQWDFDTINKRTNALADILVKHVYPLPKNNQ